MANVDNPNGFYAVQCLWGSIPIEDGYLGSNVGVKAGDAISVATTGYLSLATSASTYIMGVATETITAVAATPQKVKYVPAMPGVIFEGQCSGTSTRTNSYQACDIEGTTGIMEIDENAASTGVVLPLELIPRTGNAVGANARYRFIFRRSPWCYSAV
jgi:hypothetical protein